MNRIITILAFLFVQCFTAVSLGVDHCLVDDRFNIPPMQISAQIWNDKIYISYISPGSSTQQHILSQSDLASMNQETQRAVLTSLNNDGKWVATK
jgi:hypothetical protein